MLYQRQSFTLPATSKTLTARQYDFATLTEAEFLAKYGLEAEGYPAGDVTAAEKAKETPKRTALPFHPTPPLKL